MNLKENDIVFFFKGKQIREGRITYVPNSMDEELGLRIGVSYGVKTASIHRDFIFPDFLSASTAIAKHLSAQIAQMEKSIAANHSLITSIRKKEEQWTKNKGK